MKTCHLSNQFLKSLIFSSNHLIFLAWNISIFCFLHRLPILINLVSNIRLFRIFSGLILRRHWDANFKIREDMCQTSSQTMMCWAKISASAAEYYCDTVQFVWRQWAKLVELVSNYFLWFIDSLRTQQQSEMSDVRKADICWCVQVLQIQWSYQDIRLATQQVVQNFNSIPCLPCLWR